MIQPYNEETLEKFGQRKRIHSFNNALDEIANEPCAKRAKKSEKASQLADSSIPFVVENVMNSIIKKIVKGNIKKNEDEFEGSLPEGSGLLVTHNEGKRSYETFCTYLSQFEVVKSEQIQQVKNIYQQLTSQIVPVIDLTQSDAKLKEAVVSYGQNVSGSGSIIGNKLPVVRMNTSF